MGELNMKTAKNRISNRQRSNRGQGILEGVAGLLIITMGVVLFTGLLVNVGFSSYYKERLGFVADQTARYAGTLTSGDPASDEKKAEEFAVDMLKHMGFSGTDAKVKVKNEQVNGEEATKVEISANFPIFQQLGGIFPAKIGLNETSVSIGDGMRVAGYLRFATGDETGAGMVFDSKVNNLATDITIGGANPMGMTAQKGKAGIMVPIIKPQGLKASHGGNFSGNLNKPTLNAVSESDNGSKKQVAASQDVGSQTTGNFPG